MKISSKILSIPPYISTTWNHVVSLQMKEDKTLIVTLSSGISVEIPGLSSSILYDVFTAHSKFLEEEEIMEEENSATASSLSSTPLRIGIEGIEGLGGALQHNPQQENGPDLPFEILSKIASISKAVGVEDPAILPRPEPHCNCMHCQIARAIHFGVQASEENKDPALIEEITDADLHFHTWDIAQISEQLYTVTNPLDKEEQYQVFLGNPVGCNCGEKTCEHIKAVLNS